MRFLESILAHRARGAAMLAVNFYNYETLAATLRAARAVGCEVILQTSPSTLDYLGGPLTAAALARAAAVRHGVRAWLHLDHATDLELFKACVDAGYDSAMIDASEKDLAENIAVTRQAVSYAHPAGVAVEAELGYIPKLGQSQGAAEGFTRPQEASLFLRETGADLLAVAIGTAHGFYKQAPKLDYERLTAIRAAVEAPLVLHGGSGLGDATWRQAIRRGIVKINFATEVKAAFMGQLRTTLSATDEIDLRKVFAPAIAAAQALVSAKLRVCQPDPAGSEAAKRAEST